MKRIDAKTVSLILADYAAGDLLQAISEKRGVHRMTIGRIISKSGVPRQHRSHFLSAEEKQKVIDEYAAGRIPHEIARDRGMNTSSVWALIRRRGLSRSFSDTHKTRVINEHAFDEITERSAYWIGMLLSDGCVSDTHGTPKICLALQIGDVEHIQKFAEFIGSNHRIGISKKQARLCVRSATMAKSLAAFGVIPRKSLVASVHHSLVSNRDFWRGYIDGNGWVGFSTYKKSALGKLPQIFFCTGSEELAEQYRVFLMLSLPGFRGKVLPAPSTFNVKTGGRFAIKLADILYRNCSVALNRKLAAANEILRIADADPKWCRRTRPVDALAFSKQKLRK